MQLNKCMIEHVFYQSFLFTIIINFIYFDIRAHKKLEISKIILGYLFLFKYSIKFSK